MQEDVPKKTSVKKAERGTVMTKRVDDSGWMKWGPAEALLVFDFLFFGNFALGWMMTYLLNRPGIHDNSITRIYGVYNICIGIGSFPARPVCSIIYTVSMVFFAASCYLHWIKIYFDGGMPLSVATFWLGVAFCFALLFTLAFHVPPEGGPDDDVVENTLIHLLAFAGGLFGCGLLKIFGICEYLLLGLYGKQGARGQVYFYSFVVQAVIYILTAFILLVGLANPKLPEYIAAPHPPEHIGVDWASLILVVVAYAGPVVQYTYVPDELRNTAHIIDATQGEGFVEREGGQRGELKQVRVDDSERLKWGPAEALLIYDVIFFFNYLVGWVLTALFNPTGIDDNNVTRIWKVYNICIGVDTKPARPVCSMIYTLSILFFGASCYMHWIKVYFDGGMQLWVASVWLGVAYALILTFTLTFAVPPDFIGDPDTEQRNVAIHVLGFAGGVAGYSLFKWFGAYKYFALGMYGKNRTAGRVYFGSFIFQAIFYFGFFVTLVYMLTWPGMADKIAMPHPPEHINFDWAGNSLVIVAALGPLVQWYSVPEELRNTAQIIDATQAQVIECVPDTIAGA